MFVLKSSCLLSLEIRLSLAHAHLQVWGTTVYGITEHTATCACEEEACQEHFLIEAPASLAGLVEGF